MMGAVIFWACVLGIAYTYAGYPLLLWLMARGRIKPAPSGMFTTPPVTLLIAAYNEASVIAEKLENCLRLDYPLDRIQILVAADGSDDATPEIVRGFAHRHVELSYSPERKGKMAAINRAMPLVTGEVVVFSDANNLYDVGALRELISYFAEPTVGAVTGAKVIKTDAGALSESEGLYWKYESFIKEKETHLGTCTGVAGEILAVWRDLYEPPPDHIINDDFYIAMRIIQRGYRVIYAPKARSVEGVSASAQDEMVRRARIVAGRYQAIALAKELLPWKKPLVVWQVVSHKFLRPLVPLAMLGALLGNLLALAWPSTATGVWGALTLAAPFNAWMLGAQAVFYALALVGARVGKRGWLGKVLYLPTFLVNSNWAAVVGLYRFLAKRQTTLWQKARRS